MKDLIFFASQYRFGEHLVVLLLGHFEKGDNTNTWEFKLKGF